MKRRFSAEAREIAAVLVVAWFAIAGGLGVVALFARACSERW